MLIFSQIIYFFRLGPLKKLEYFGFVVCGLNFIQILAALLFSCTMDKEIKKGEDGKGCTFWLYYFCRILGTMLTLLASLTFFIIWIARYWMSHTFDPTGLQNIMKENNKTLRDLDQLLTITYVECIILGFMLYHYAQCIYMMRLYTESYEDLAQKVHAGAKI